MGPLRRYNETSLEHAADTKNCHSVREDPVFWTCPCAKCLKTTNVELVRNESDAAEVPG